MRNLLSGLVLGLGTLTAPAIASADPVVILPPASVHVGGPNFRVDVTPAGARGQIGPVSFGQPTRITPPPPPVYVPAPAPAPQGWSYGGRWEGQRRRAEVMSYGNELRRDVAEVGRDLSFAVSRGNVRPEAMRAFEDGRRDLERDFEFAAAKGFLTYQDRAHFDSDLAGLRSLRDQFRCRPGRGFGFGFGHGHERDRDHDGRDDRFEYGYRR